MFTKSQSPITSRITTVGIGMQVFSCLKINPFLFTVFFYTGRKFLAFLFQLSSCNWRLFSLCITTTTLSLVERRRTWDFIWQYDGLPHWQTRCDWLNNTPNCWIGQHCPNDEDCSSWPPHSTNLRPCSFIFEGLQNTAYMPPLPPDLPKLRSPRVSSRWKNKKTVKVLLSLSMSHLHL